MSERRESRLRTTLLAGTLATGLAALFPTESHAQNAAAEAGIGDLMRARDPRMGNEGLAGFDFRRDAAFDERERELDFETRFEEGAARGTQLWLRRQARIRLPGELFFDDNVPGSGGRVGLRFPIHPPED